MEAVPTKTTIREVARAAGVGIGTISCVLNSSSQVSRKTRARVLDAIHRLGFRPNAQARRILKRRAEMVCFLLSNRDFLHPFHARILQGVESYASGMKQHVLFAALHYSPRTSPDRIDLPVVLQEHGLIDGLILAGTIYPNLLRRIESIRMPFVAFSNNVVGMRENKLKPVLIMARNPQSFVDFGQKSTQRILSRKPRPTAVVAGNDEIAYGLWRSLQRHAVKVPDDISLVGFDDREEAVLMDPQLSTVRVHKEEIGETCVKMLLERLHHPQMAFSQRILPTEFVIRGTVRQL